MKKGLLNAVLKAWLVAGTLDILTACMMYWLRTGKDPLFVLKVVASGALGKDAYVGGAGTNFLGLLFHFIIALSWTVAYFIIYPKLPKGNWIVMGLIYGIVVWIGMNLVVLPLSQIGPQPFVLTAAIRGALVLMIMIGLPISFVSSRYYGRV